MIQCPNSFSVAIEIPRSLRDFDIEGIVYAVHGHFQSSLGVYYPIKTFEKEFSKVYTAFITEEDLEVLSIFTQCYVRFERKEIFGEVFGVSFISQIGGSY